MTTAERNWKIAAQISATTSKGLKSRKAARDILIAEGIYTRGGNLKAEFGGKGWRSKATAAPGDPKHPA